MRWFVEHAFLLVPAQSLVAQHLASFQQFPPRQKPGSFSIEQVMEKLRKSTIQQLAASSCVRKEPNMKPIAPSPGIDRRAPLSTLALLPALSAPLLPVSAPAQTATSGGGSCGAARALPVDTCLLTEDARQLMATWDVVVHETGAEAAGRRARAAGSVSEPLRNY